MPLCPSCKGHTVVTRRAAWNAGRSVSTRDDGARAFTVSCQAELNAPPSPPPSRDQLKAALAFILLFGFGPAAVVLLFAPIVPFALLAVACIGVAAYMQGTYILYMSQWFAGNYSAVEHEFDQALRTYEAQWFCRSCNHVWVESPLVRSAALNLPVK